MRKYLFWIMAVGVMLVGGGYTAGYWLGADMATNKCEDGIEQMGIGFAVKLAEAIDGSSACYDLLEDSQGMTDELLITIEEQMIPRVDDLSRLTVDLTFDLLQCRGGNEVMLQACTMDSNCSNCLQQFAGDEGGGMHGPTEKEFCIQNALLDKNEWYDLMDLPYYDGCAWDNCACADDEFIESSPESCPPELLAYYNK